MDHAGLEQLGQCPVGRLYLYTHVPGVAVPRDRESRQVVIEGRLERAPGGVGSDDVELVPERNRRMSGTNWPVEEYRLP